VARVLAALGTERALVVHGADGLDEITTTTTTYVAEVKGEDVAVREIDPDDLGLPRATLDDLRGGEPGENADRLEALFAGERGPLADVVAANAGAAIWIAGRSASLRAGVAAAEAILASGRARAKLDELRAFR
jgi:anthranilate phosphoribosyltransferase